MLRLIPAIILVFVGMVSMIPWYPRELGWYATDAGIRLPALAPFPVPLPLIEITLLEETVEPPVSASDVNRSRSFVIALVVALIPTLSAIVATEQWRKPWDIFGSALRAGPW
jgi:hypothetical protein